MPPSGGWNLLDPRGADDAAVTTRAIADVVPVEAAQASGEALTAEKPTADCYAAGERGAMEGWQDWRARWLRPLLVVLTRCQVTPDHITLASLVVGLAFCPLWMWPGTIPGARIAAVLCLVVHALLDALDGPLARHQGTASRSGSFTDSLADQIVVTASTLALMAGPQPSVGIWVGGIYIFAYSIVVGFAMVRNALGVGYSWLVRPRLWIYAWLFVEALWLPGTIEWVMGLFTVPLLLKMATGFVAIRRML
jgi:phosphatidylglycerophosphate synthase